jgi:hypothetical protein
MQVISVWKKVLKKCKSMGKLSARVDLFGIK